MIRFDRLKRGLYEVLGGAADVVAWGKGEQARGTGTLLTLDVVSGPVGDNRRHARGYTAKPPDSLVVEVGAVTVGQRAQVVINGFAYLHDVAAGETPEDVRDELLADVIEGDGSTITATAVSTNQINLAADTIGAILDVSLDGPVTLASSTFSGSTVTVTAGSKLVTIQLEAFSASDATTGAQEILSEAIDRFEDEDREEELAHWGIALRDHTSPTDISAIAGAHWESRAICEVEIALPSVVTRPVEHVTAADYELTIDGVETVTGSISP